MYNSTGGTMEGGMMTSVVANNNKDSSLTTQTPQGQHMWRQNKAVKNQLNNIQWNIKHLNSSNFYKNKIQTNVMFLAVNLRNDPSNYLAIITYLKLYITVKLHVLFFFNIAI